MNQNKRSEDRVRAELITRFFCAECGGALSMTYDTEAVKNRDGWVDGDKSGAFVRYNKICIHPCVSCISKYTGPAKKIMEGIRALEAQEGGDV